MVAAFAIGCSHPHDESWRGKNYYGLTDRDLSEAREALCKATAGNHAEGSDFVQQALGLGPTYKAKIAMGVVIDEYYSGYWSEADCGVRDGKIAELMHQHPAENGS